MYGACIVWYELLPSEVVSTYLEEDASLPYEDSVSRDPPVLHAPEAICLLSRCATFDALMECCRQLFRMRISSDDPLPEESLAPLLHTPSPNFGASPRPPSSAPLSNPPCCDSMTNCLRASLLVPCPARINSERYAMMCRHHGAGPSGERECPIHCASGQSAAAHNGWSRFPSLVSSVGCGKRHRALGLTFV